MIRDRIKEFRRVPVADLLENGRNFRRHPQAQKDALAGVLAEVGIAGALVAYHSARNEGKLTLIDGHARLQAGAVDWPVLILDVDDAEADYLLATFDATTAMAELDGVALAELLKTIQSGEPGVQELLAQLAEQAGALVPIVNEGQTDEDAVPEPPDEATSQRGRVYRLGNHRLMCGDSSKAEDLDRLLAGAPIHLVNTDPPYNVNLAPRTNNAILAGAHGLPHDVAEKVESVQGYDVHRLGVPKIVTRKLRPRDRVLANDFLSDDEFYNQLVKWFGNMARVLEPGRGFYAWGGYLNWPNYCPALAQVGLYFSQGITWVKHHPVLGRTDMMNDCEHCWYGWKEGGPHQWIGPNNVSNIWEVKKVNPASMVHLTEKPVELAVRAISYSSRQGENVLDLFGGSGSTLIGCEKTGRRAHLMELDALYCDVIRKRWAEFVHGEGCDWVALTPEAAE